VSRQDLKTPIQIQYGRVDEVEKVRVESQAGTNAIIGGVVGALVNKNNRLAGAAVGAGAAGLATAVAEGVHEAFAYSVRLDTGAMIKVIVDHGDVAVGQCVAVEQGRTANVRVVSPGHCRPEYAAAGLPPDVASRALDHASACDQAKEAVLAAATAQELDLLAQKARIVCGH
jgi:hypothetical protein